MGISLRGIAGFAPYAQQVLANKQARDEIERKQALAELARQQQENHQNVIDTMAYQKNAADIMHTEAATRALQNPPEKSTDYDLRETDQGLVRVPRQGPAGVVTGPDGKPLRAPKPQSPAPRPMQAPYELTPEGIKATATKAAAVAKAEAPYKKDPNAPSASSAKLTEPQEKSYLFYKLMEGAEPAIDAAMKTGKVRRAAISAYINSPEMAAPLVNSRLNAEEQSYVRAFRDFAAGVLRKESGAAVTPAELREVWARYATGFGDDPRLDAEKATARKSYMETMKQQATPALQYYGKQGGGSGSPNAAPTREQQLWDAAVKKHGRAKVEQLYGPRPGGEEEE